MTEWIKKKGKNPIPNFVPPTKDSSQLQGHTESEEMETDSPRTWKPEASRASTLTPEEDRLYFRSLNNDRGVTSSR